MTEREDVGSEAERKPGKCSILEAKCRMCTQKEKVIECVKWSDWAIIIRTETQSLDAGKSEIIDDMNKEKSGVVQWGTKID